MGGEKVAWTAGREERMFPVYSASRNLHDSRTVSSALKGQRRAFWVMDMESGKTGCGPWENKRECEQAKSSKEKQKRVGETSSVEVLEK